MQNRETTLARDREVMLAQDDGAMLAQDGGVRPLNRVHGSATPSDEFVSSSLKEGNETCTVVPPVVIRNPYKKIQMNKQNITQFCKPIYTPRFTVRNPYARNSKVDVHAQLVSQQVLTPKPFLPNALDAVERSHAYDTAGSVALTPHNPKQLFHVKTKHMVSIFHMKKNLRIEHVSIS